MYCRLNCFIEKTVNIYYQEVYDKKLKKLLTRFAQNRARKKFLLTEVVYYHGFDGGLLK